MENHKRTVPDDRSDLDIIQNILNGHVNSYEILMRRYNQKLYRVIKGYISVETDVEEIMQITYIKSFEKLNSFKFQSSFSTWLIRIGINTTLNYLSHKEKNKLSLYDFNDSALGGIQDTNKNNPENIYVMNEMKDSLERAINQLEPKYRLFYILREVEGMDLDEIKECTNISKGNIRIRVHRAKRMLKEYIVDLTKSTDTLEFGNFRCDRVVVNVMNSIS